MIQPISYLLNKWPGETSSCNFLNKHTKKISVLYIIVDAGMVQIAQFVLNSLRPSDAYMHHQPRPSLVHIMAWRLVGIKPFFIQENTFENVVCEMVAILSWPRCVKADKKVHPTQTTSWCWPNFQRIFYVPWVEGSAWNGQSPTRPIQLGFGLSWLEIAVSNLK